MITIFTPTYNRAYIIGNLYKSLLVQTSKDFEWLIVDDGSTDDTETLVSSFIKENKIAICYIKQQNGGKHKAINRGVEEAKGDLFFIVDSDDYLSQDAVEKLSMYYHQIEADDSFAGVSGIRVSFSGERIGGEFKYHVLDCSSLDLRLKYHVAGDMAEAFKTAVLRKYPFPVFEGERFCPEALIWNRISLKYKLRFTDAPIYKCEYLPDGLTVKIVKLRMNSTEASLLYYSELNHMPIPFIQKLKVAINYWRFAFCSKKSFGEKLEQIGVCSLVMYPFGLLFHLKDSRS
jgi:glycosyltransferase involved in cell wall biosynthesis